MANGRGMTGSDPGATGDAQRSALRDHDAQCIDHCASQRTLSDHRTGSDRPGAGCFDPRPGVPGKNASFIACGPQGSPTSDAQRPTFPDQINYAAWLKERI